MFTTAISQKDLQLIQESASKKAIEIAHNLLQRGMDALFTAEVTGLSLAQIQALNQKPQAKPKRKKRRANNEVARTESMPSLIPETEPLRIPPIKEFTPEQFKQMRLRFGASQAVFGAYLNTTSSTTQKWEQGKRKPKGLALKLLNMVDAKGLEILT